MAQRLLRKLCDKCKKKAALDEKQNKIIKKVATSILDKSYLKGLTTENIFEPVGCAECNFTGFKGRTGIFEAILTDEKIENIVNQNPSEREINKAAEGQ